jgi:hypothetical protein
MKKVLPVHMDKEKGSLPDCQNSGRKEAGFSFNLTYVPVK